MTARKKRAGQRANADQTPDTSKSERIVEQPEVTPADARIRALVQQLRRRRWALPLTALAQGHTVRIGVLDFRGLWQGQAADEITVIKTKWPGVSWVRLTPDAWSREVFR
jgi:hypothetical protein